MVQRLWCILPSLLALCTRWCQRWVRDKFIRGRLRWLSGWLAVEVASWTLCDRFRAGYSCWLSLIGTRDVPQQGFPIEESFTSPESMGIAQNWDAKTEHCIVGWLFAKQKAQNCTLSIDVFDDGSEKNLESVAVRAISELRSVEIEIRRAMNLWILRDFYWRQFRMNLVNITTFRYSISTWSTIFFDVTRVSVLPRLG